MALDIACMEEYLKGKKGEIHRHQQPGRMYMYIARKITVYKHVHQIINNSNKLGYIYFPPQEVSTNNTTSPWANYCMLAILNSMYLQVVSVVEVVTADIQGRAAVDLGEDSLTVGMLPPLEYAD